MTAVNTHDWTALREKLIAALKSKKVKSLWADCAAYLDLNVTTLRSAAKREWKVSHPRELVADELDDELPTDQGLDISEDTNLLEINYVGKHAHTLDELILQCKIDTTIWRPADFKANAWENSMKIRRNDEEYVVVVPLYQVKAYFTRINPIPIMPMLVPVEVKVTLPTREKIAKGGGLKKALIIPDPQIGFRRRLHDHTLDPFHDRQALDLALQIAKAEKVDSIEFVGDWLDMSEWSTRWTPEPEFFWTTMPALIEAAWWLGAFSFVPVKRLLEGNHERRMRDWINTYARAAYGIRPVDELDLPPTLSIERLIPMEKLGIEYIKGYPSNSYWLNDNILIEHGDVARAAPGATANAIVNKSTYTTIFGHIHRRELVSRRIKTRDGDAFQTAFSPGCTCRIDGAVPGATDKSQWQQGLGIVEYTQERDNLIPIAIEKGEAIYGGKVFKARPMQEISAEMDEMIQTKLSGMKM